MTFQQLQYVLAAFEHGSFSAAAQALHLAQPSLSEQVRRLEAELGIKLFERVGRGLVPTEAGRGPRAPAEGPPPAGAPARAAGGAARGLRGGAAALGPLRPPRPHLRPHL